MVKHLWGNKMAYLKILSDKTHHKIGEIRLIDNQNIIFDTKRKQSRLFHFCRR